MRLPSSNPIKKYEHGYPCMLDETVGRIIGESEDAGSWGIFNGVRMFSVPLFCTPHGTITRTGVAYLSEITEEGMKKLLDYEKDALSQGKDYNYYAGKYADTTLPQGLLDAIFKTALDGREETIEAPANPVEALTQKSYLVGVHRHAFRAGEPAEIIGLKWVRPSPIERQDWRLAYEIEFFDGKKDFTPLSDVLAGNHVIISDVDLANERIPEISK